MKKQNNSRSDYAEYSQNNTASSVKTAEIFFASTKYPVKQRYHQENILKTLTTDFMAEAANSNVVQVLWSK